MLFSHRQILTSAFERAIQAIAEQHGYAQATPNAQLDVPKDPQHGESACNIAMQLAKPMRSNPRTLAQQLVDVLNQDESLKDLVHAFEVAGPGFINIRLSHAAKVQVVSEVRALGAQYGHSTRYAGQKVMLEFVSANPTGPLHVGHGRQAALGDALAAVMQTQGWQVHREFYYNDAGVQIETLAKSVQARLQDVKPGDADWPESAYNGEYIKDIACAYAAGETVQAADGNPVRGGYGQVDTDINNGGGGGGGFSTKYGDSPNSDMQAIRDFAVAYLRHEQDRDLKAFGVAFDKFYLESSLYTEGKVDAAVKAMVASNHTYEHEGALWLRTTTMGDDKDRVMRKSDGTYTYFVPDVAYHIDKFQRGFTKVINIQGTDHHGTIARVRAGLQAVNVGIPEGYPDYVLHTMVRVMRGGEEVKISKRAGSYVTLRDLIAWSGGADENNDLLEQPVALQKGRDAVRFFLISRKADTEFVFDVDLALAQSDENPVYYVQYAHARIQSIIRQAEVGHQDVNGADLSLLQAPAEFALMRVLAEYGDVLTKAADELAPHHVAFYLRELSAAFHAFYNAERVRVDDVQLKLARVALLEAVAVVLRSGLSVLGVSAPNAM